jgi:hypothetical protein
MATGRSRGINLDDLILRRRAPEPYGDSNGGGGSGGATGEGMRGSGGRKAVDNRRRIAPQPINRSGGDTLVRREMDEPQLQTEKRGKVASDVDVRAPASDSGYKDNNDGDDDDNGAFGGAMEGVQEDDDGSYNSAIVATGSDGAP